MAFATASALGRLSSFLPLVEPRIQRGAYSEPHLAPERSVVIGRFGLPVHPRIGGGKAAERNVEPVVSVPPSTSSSDDRSLGNWACTHPARAALLLALGISAFQQIRVDRNKKSAPLVPAPAPVSGPEDEVGRLQACQGGGYTQAVPEKHEVTSEAMDLLDQRARKYVVVCGKGGVGKTSMTCALATKLADRGQKTLILSTDPAHSLSDAFEKALRGAGPEPVEGVKNLYVQEVRPQSTENFFQVLSPSLAAKSKGVRETDFEGLNALFQTLPPCFEEAVALADIVKLLEDDQVYSAYDRIVFDTAPTGNMLRLMSMPHFFDTFLLKLDSLLSKWNAKDDMDIFKNRIEELKGSMAVVCDLFRDKTLTEFVVTTLPSVMAIAESKRLAEDLEANQVLLRYVFVNQVQPQNPGCSSCSTRREEHTSNLAYVQNQFQGLRMATVQSFDTEVVGVASFRAIGAQLFPLGDVAVREISNGTKSSNVSAAGEYGESKGAEMVAGSSQISDTLEQNGRAAKRTGPTVSGRTGDGLSNVAIDTDRGDFAKQAKVPKTMVEDAGSLK